MRGPKRGRDHFYELEAGVNTIEPDTGINRWKKDPKSRKHYYMKLIKGMEAAVSRQLGLSAR